MLKRLWILMLLLLTAVTAHTTTLTLAAKHGSQYVIVLPDRPTPPDVRAAEELQRFLLQICRAWVPIHTVQGPVPETAILLGTADTNRHIRSLGLKLTSKQMADDEIFIRTEKGRLILGGGQPRGTLYAVYAFLEQCLGCRWYAADCSRIPATDTIEFGDLDIREKPAFEYREGYFDEARQKDWASRNRTNGSLSWLDASTGGKIMYFPWCHTFYNLIPPAKYSKTHPEYFAEIKGKRKFESAQLCLSNPDVRKVGLAQIEEWIKAEPRVKIISISQNDCYDPCQCAACRKIANEERSESGLVLRFVNSLAREVGKKHPDKLIDTLAYQFTEEPPYKVRPAANVRVRMAPISNCFGHPFDTCPENRKAYDNLLAWSKITKNLYIWHYCTNFAHYPMPFPDLDEIAGSLRAYQRVGVKGVYLEGDYAEGGGGEMAELRSWVMAKLLWNPDQDVWKLTDEFVDGYYGQGGAAIGKYLRMTHEAVKKENLHFRIYDAPDRVGYLRRDLVDAAEALFEQAEQAVSGNPEQLARVQKARLSIDYVRLYNAKDPAEKSKYARIVTDKVKRFGLQQIREGQPIDQYLNSLVPLMK